MKQSKQRDHSYYYYLDIIERTARKYESDLVGSGRFTFIKTEGHYRLYKEEATGNVVRIIIPFMD